MNERLCINDFFVGNVLLNGYFHNERKVMRYRGRGFEKLFGKGIDIDGFGNIFIDIIQYVVDELVGGNGGDILFVL